MKSILSQSALRLGENYLFERVAKERAEYVARNPMKRVIDLGIGDTRGPLPSVCIEAMTRAIKEQKSTQTFRGYGPSNGYEFCRKAVADYYKRRHGVEIDENDVFIGDGAKSGIDRIMACFDCPVIIPSPVYPAYRDCAHVRGMTVVYAPRKGELPQVKSEQGYLIVLCSPDNPTGQVLAAKDLEAWVEFAKESGSVILFDGAYERFCDNRATSSVFCISNASEVAVEVGSLSKSACFTGLRLGWTIVPSRIMGGKLKNVYSRILASAYNGAPYVVQRAAEAALSKQGVRESTGVINIAKSNANKLKSALKSVGIKCKEHVNSPYVWAQCPRGMNAEQTFRFFLENCAIVLTPGSGFGEEGEGYIRLSALCLQGDAEEAAERIKAVFARFNVDKTHLC